MLRWWNSNTLKKGNNMEAERKLMVEKPGLIEEIGFKTHNGCWNCKYMDRLKDSHHRMRARCRLFNVWVGQNGDCKRWRYFA